MQVIDKDGNFFNVFRSLSNEQPSRTILVQQNSQQETVAILAFQGSRGSNHFGWHRLGIGDWATIDEILEHYGLTPTPIR